MADRSPIWNEEPELAAEGERLRNEPRPANDDAPVVFAPEPFRAADLASLAPREWALGTRFQRGKTTGGLAPGGVGKTSSSLLTAVSFITGRPLTGEKVHVRGRALIVSNEEEIPELLRRLWAICIYYKIDPTELDGKIFLHSGVGSLVRVATLKDGATCREPLVDAMIRFIQENDILYVCMDPFVTFHTFPENDNTEVDFAARQFNVVALAGNCAVDLLHHVRKDSDSEAHAGDVNAARGAGAIGAAVRFAYTLASMSETTQAKLNLTAEERVRLYRMDDAKANNALLSAEATWFYRETVILPNGPNGGDGDAVGCPRLFDLKARHQEAARQADAEDEPERASCAEVVVRAMSTDEVPVKGVVAAVADHFRIGERSARTRIGAAIPTAPGAREVTLDGQRYGVWMRAESAHPKAGKIIVRQVRD